MGLAKPGGGKVSLTVLNLGIGGWDGPGVGMGSEVYKRSSGVESLDLTLTRPAERATGLAKPGAKPGGGRSSLDVLTLCFAGKRL